MFERVLWDLNTKSFCLVCSFLPGFTTAYSWFVLLQLSSSLFMLNIWVGTSSQVAFFFFPYFFLLNWLFLLLNFPSCLRLNCFFLPLYFFFCLTGSSLLPSAVVLLLSFYFRGSIPSFPFFACFLPSCLFLLLLSYYWLFEPLYSYTFSVFCFSVHCFFSSSF